jgi:hypothetical protein
MSTVNLILGLVETTSRRPDFFLTREAFLLCFPSFATPSQVLEVLFERYAAEERGGGASSVDDAMARQEQEEGLGSGVSHGVHLLPRSSTVGSLYGSAYGADSALLYLRKLDEDDGNGSDPAFSEHGGSGSGSHTDGSLRGLSLVCDEDGTVSDRRLTMVPDMDSDATVSSSFVSSSENQHLVRSSSFARSYSADAADARTTTDTASIEFQHSFSIEDAVSLAVGSTRASSDHQPQHPSVRRGGGLAASRGESVPNLRSLGMLDRSGGTATQWRIVTLLGAWLKKPWAVQDLHADPLALDRLRTFLDENAKGSEGIHKLCKQLRTSLSVLEDMIRAWERGSFDDAPLSPPPTNVGMERHIPPFESNRIYLRKKTLSRLPSFLLSISTTYPSISIYLYLSINLFRSGDIDACSLSLSLSLSIYLRLSLFLSISLSLPLFLSLLSSLSPGIAVNTVGKLVFVSPPHSYSETAIVLSSLDSPRLNPQPSPPGGGVTGATVETIVVNNSDKSPKVSLTSCLDLS